MLVRIFERSVLAIQTATIAVRMNPDTVFRIDPFWLFQGAVKGSSSRKPPVLKNEEQPPGKKTAPAMAPVTWHKKGFESCFSSALRFFLASHQVITSKKIAEYNIFVWVPQSNRLQFSSTGQLKQSRRINMFKNAKQQRLNESKGVLSPIRENCFAYLKIY